MEVRVLKNNTSFRWGRVMLEDIIIGVPPPSDLANLGIPCKLRIVAFKCPKPIGSHRVAPHLLRLCAPVLHSINVFPKPPIPFLRIFHQLQYQVFREFHDESHLSLSSLPFQLCKPKTPKFNQF
ncbi:hypothetical protein CR513_26372, partial [Mucuna pruriens]